jgi:5-oxoprolinase (ATP-hydrolysing) subunit A
MRAVDVNCDLGESFGNWRMGNDELVIPEITSANVACGFHASDPVTMIEAVKRCHEHGVAIGAHPGLPDLLGFGRRAMAIDPDDAYAYIVYQAGALQGVAQTMGESLHHIKPHGAMYSILRRDEQLAAAAAQAIADFNSSVLVYWPAPVSAALPSAARERGIRVIGEMYPDLDIAADGGLVLQRAKHETDVDAAYRKVRLWLEEGVVEATDGSRVELEAESVCVHGDGPNALDVVKAVKRAISDAGCEVAVPSEHPLRTVSAR